ncbi:RDD family protein [Nocardia puris]|uniref:RDD family protein n=1 Tax=Nocardia puris TaxID=208602 RepID=A0A366D142_9NOCA|nr:RDD family protein [Nocardia puris]
MWVAPEAPEGRLVLAATVDGLLALGGGIALAVVALGMDLGDLILIPTFLGLMLVLSFVNHVFGTVLFRGGLADHLFGLRVIRAKDGGRPGFWRSVYRWITGYVLVVFMSLLGEGGTIGEACGLRTVLRRHLVNHTY